MSDFADKLAMRHYRPTAGRAQDSGKHLLGRWGASQPDASTIVIDTMGGREVWRRVSGDVFEQEVRS